LAFWLSVNYSVAQWYRFKHRNETMVFGATFIPNYAKSYGLDPKETLNAMLKDLGLRQIRLVSYWKDIEKEQGTYNFSELDWQFDMVERYGGRVSLAIGLRQPRWPECHEPDWAKRMTMEQWYPHLESFMGAVIERYKDRPSLVSYQLENEFFMSVFGICPDFSRERLVKEFEFVKSKDPDTPVIVSRSNNWIGIPYRAPRADTNAISIYKRVWDSGVTKRYYEYPLPAWFYAMLAGWSELLTGRNMVIHELQAESWLPPGYSMKTAPTEELHKSLDADRLRHRFGYAEGTGMKEVYLWGVEWWYYQKEKRSDPELWNTAKEELTKRSYSVGN